MAFTAFISSASVHIFCGSLAFMTLCTLGTHFPESFDFGTAPEKNKMHNQKKTKYFETGHHRDPQNG
ncbi:MAG: hypothetical protein WCP20_01725 [Desulfuromonadales bacterium]